MTEREAAASEPRVTVNGFVGQIDATQVPRYGGEPTFARRDASGAWSSAFTFIEEPDAVPYVKVASNGRDTIDFAFTDGHPRNKVTSIYFAKYEDGLLRHADGKRRFERRLVAQRLVLGDRGEGEAERISRDGGE